MIIALDGPAAAGKGTLGRALAAHYRLPYLDTGVLYRATARDVLAAGGDPENEEDCVRAARALDPATFDDPELRRPEIGEAASKIARIPAVRKVLLDYQRRFARNPRGAILDGRDIGTVVCPDADVKLFVTASPEARARRRHAELAAAGSTLSFEEVLAQVRERDERDARRALSPMRPAADAHLLDTTDLGIEAAFKAAVDIIDTAVGKAGCA
ncbi:MAG: (d)CMP kinase [Alphaproteobacteria bacterium]|nr:MAG: (d)CMP kinase [Alphaproteobacteria bacterium]